LRKRVLLRLGRVRFRLLDLQLDRFRQRERDACALRRIPDG
jgi:hypothetical protein